jgi:plastocyanin
VNRRGSPHVSTGMLTLVHTRPTRLLLAVLAAGSLTLGAAACSDDDDAGSDTTDTTAAETDGAPAAGTIVAADFSLTDLTVAPGEEIVLDNTGSAPHTATADDGAFDTGQVSGGDTSDPVAAPDEPGSYAFHCEVHPNMTATLTVEG